MRSRELLDSAPVHEMSFDEFSANVLVACVRASAGGGFAVVDVDSPGWAGLDKIRVEVVRMFSAKGYARTTASTLTNSLVRQGLDDGFTNDCKYIRLDGPCTLVFVKEHAARNFSPRDVLRRVYSDAQAEAGSDRQGINSAPEGAALC